MLELEQLRLSMKAYQERLAEMGDSL